MTRDAKLLKALQQGVRSNVLADIWSEGNVALLGIMGVFIDDNWEINELLIKAAPFSQQAHTANNIKAEISNALLACGLAKKLPSLDDLDAEVRAHNDLKACACTACLPQQIARQCCISYSMCVYWSKHLYHMHVYQLL